MHRTPVINSIAVSNYEVDKFPPSSKEKHNLGVGHFMANEDKFNFFLSITSMAREV